VSGHARAKVAAEHGINLPTEEVSPPQKDFGAHLFEELGGTKAPAAIYVKHERADKELVLEEKQKIGVRACKRLGKIFESAVAEKARPEMADYLHISSGAPEFRQQVLRLWDEAVSLLNPVFEVSEEA
jgi:hypothetical protein